MAVTVTNNPFPAAGGYGNLPNGNWSPIAYSKDVIMFNRKMSVASEITNTSFFNEIMGYGSQVEVIKEPQFTVQDFVRGQEIEFQHIDDDAISVVIDQGKQFGFTIDDIESKMSHIDWYAKAVSAGAYQLTQAFDTDILSYIVSNVGQVDGTGDAADTGTTASPVAIGFQTTDTTPLDYMNDCKLNLDLNDTMPDNRIFVASPNFYNLMRKEDSSLMDASFTGTGGSDIFESSRMATSKLIHGFKCYVSNNLPANTDIIYGHKDAVAAAQTLSKTKSGEVEKAFAQYYASLVLWGRKVIKTEDIFTGEISGI
jgi:hypothetical protein